MALPAWKRSKFGCVDGEQSSLENLKEKQNTVAHLRALEEGLGKLLKLTEVKQFQSK